MTITIYNYTDDFPRLDKTNFIQQIATHTGTMNDSVDVVSPEILVHGNVTTGNYAKINEFDSYYFIREKTVVRNNLTRLVLKRDSAFTFLSGILNSSCICARNGKQGNYNSDFADNRYKVLQNKIIETYALESLSNDDAIVFAFVE